MRLWLSSDQRQEPYDMGPEHVDKMFDIAEKYQTEDSADAQESVGVVPEKAQEYTGFLCLECAKCHTISTFCAKKPLSEYRCKECGGRTRLGVLKQMHMRCTCGKDWTYRTNLTASEHTLMCLECGRKVTMRINQRGTAYVTD